MEDTLKSILWTVDWIMLSNSIDEEIIEKVKSEITDSIKTSLEYLIDRTDRNAYHNGVSKGINLMAEALLENK